jgi:hypothetical protein
MHSGHYYCYVRSAMGIWHEMDDEVGRCRLTLSIPR